MNNKCPIIFSNDAVRAILAGSKTQFRCVVEPQPNSETLGVYADPYNHGPDWAFWLPDNRMTEPRTWLCPYGMPGDKMSISAAVGCALEVVSVQIERLQSITHIDCVEEGWPYNEKQAKDVDIARAIGGAAGGNIDDAAIEWYANLWDGCNDKQPWESNPWVWRIEFKCVEPTRTHVHLL